MAPTTNAQAYRSRWTHPSVRLLAREHDPSEAISERAREAVFKAIQQGWSGPPFSPFDLAEVLGIRVVPNESVVDARIIPSGVERVTIEYNPNRPNGRMRYSIAHELAHALFPDCRDHVRHRLAKGAMREDEWQLEMLCNLGAAEFLMPVGSFPVLRQHDLDIDRLMELRREYDVSAEALLLRAVKLTEAPCVVFCACRHGVSGAEGRYAFDYAVASQSQTRCPQAGAFLPKRSPVEECTGIGYTSKGDEEWPQMGKVHVECVGIPPYPGHVMPRVSGIARMPDGASRKANQIQILRGNALEPRGEGTKVIAFIVNDKGLSWGAGFALAVQRKWPVVQREFEGWIRNRGRESILGSVHVSQVEDGPVVCEMVAQHGYGPSPKPRIRYAALDKCLADLASHAASIGASVHMPRIGAGQAGGSWPIIEELIQKNLCRRGVDVRVYDLPGAPTQAGSAMQPSLFNETGAVGFGSGR